jgi:hypothetical protein
MSHTLLERPWQVELKSQTEAFESTGMKSYEPLKFADHCLNGDVWEFEKLGHQMAPFWSDFRAEKMHADLGCQKPPHTKFQLKNLSCSGEVKS